VVVLVAEVDTPWVRWAVVDVNNAIGARALVTSLGTAPPKAGVLNARATDTWLANVPPPSTLVKMDVVSNVTSVEK